MGFAVFCLSIKHHYRQNKQDMRRCPTPTKRIDQLSPRGHARALPILGGQSGQMMIQALISIGILAIVTMAFLTLISSQTKETRAISEKLALLDLERLLISSLADGSVCVYVLNNPTVQTFNSLGPFPQTITLRNPTPTTAALYTTILSNPAPPPNWLPGPVAVQVNQANSAFAPSLVTTSIQLQIDGGAAGNYSGKWLVSFDSSKTVRPIKGLSISTTLTADISSPAAAKITGCQSGGSGSGSTPGVFQRVFTTSGTYTPCNRLIQAQVEVVGAGGGGGSGSSVLGSGGGGSGAYARAIFTGAQIGASQAITVGSPGLGAASGSGADGGVGGASSFGGLLSAGGGGGGSGGATAGLTCVGGTGGAIGTIPAGGLAAPGAAGVGCLYYFYEGAGGSGGASHFGGSGVGGTASPSGPGQNGSMGGGGGGSGSVIYNNGPQGGNGGGGVVVVTETCG